MVSETEKKGTKVHSSNNSGKRLNPLKKIREYSKLLNSRSTIMLDRQHTLTNSSFGISGGKSEFYEHQQPEGPSLRLTQSHLSKSVVEPSIIEPVERHLPKVRGAHKFSHFSRDRVITSFGGGVDFRTYKPL